MRRRPDTERIYLLVGQKVERQRREAKYSQTQLAQNCGLSRGSIANIESGNQRPTLHTLWSIADALNVDVHSFFPSRDEFQSNESDVATPKITSWLKEEAEKSQMQVNSFIVDSLVKVGSDVGGEKS